MKDVSADQPDLGPTPSGTRDPEMRQEGLTFVTYSPKFKITLCNFSLVQIQFEVLGLGVLSG